jgi:hypothetical protein
MAKLFRGCNSYEVLYGGCIYNLYVDAVVVAARADTTTASNFDWFCGMGSRQPF